MTEARFLLGLARPHRALLAMGAALMVVDSAAALGVPLLAGSLAGELLAKYRGIGIANALVAMLALFALQAACRAGSRHWLEAAADRVAADLRVRLYDHLQALPLAFHDRRRLGDVVSLLASDAYVVGGYIGGTATAVAPLLVTAAGAALMMAGIHFTLALAAMVLVPFFYLLMKVATRGLRPLALELQEAEADVVATAQENLGSLAAIKAFTREARESARFRGRIDRLVELSSRQRRILAAFGPLMEFVAAAGVLLLFVLATSGIAGLQLGAAASVTFLLYALLLSRPVAGLADVYGRTQAMRGALSRLIEALREAPEPAGGKTLPAVTGEIEIRGLRFTHEGREAAIDGIDLHVRAGETIVLVGPNGAGKSTLAGLLLRLHSPQAGYIRIDGVDIAGVSLASLRRQVGLVPQHALLLNASILANIAYGAPDASCAEIEAAARAAGAHEFIACLPLGYDTAVGERGVRLSGGEQQKIALARALLKDPPILILDEATSMFDPASEREFFEASAATLRARTVILIAHRAAGLARADRVVHMNAGKIVLVESARPRYSSPALSR